MTDSNFNALRFRFYRCRVAELFLIFFTFVFPLSEGSAAEIFYQLDFTQAGTDGRGWLVDNGFEPIKDMKKGGKIGIDGGGTSGGLSLSSSSPAFGFVLKGDLHVENVEIVEIEWGVERYPGGRLWTDGLNREALMVQLFFGEKVKADTFYLPDSPHMIGLFLCQGDPIGIPFTARSYRETARYVCLDGPPEGKTVLSRFPVSENYKTWFGSSLVPPVTGLGIELDTSDVAGGEAAAFIKKLTMYGQSK